MKKQISIALVATLSMASVCASQKRCAEQGRPQRVNRALLESMSGGQQIPADLVRLTDQLTTRIHRSRLVGHTSNILAGKSIHFSPNSNRVVSWDKDNNVKVWDTLTGRCLHTNSMPNLGWVLWTLVFSPDSQFAASQLVSNDYFVWELDTGSIQGSGLGRKIKPLAFSPDSKIIAYWSSVSNKVYFRNVASEETTTLSCRIEDIWEGVFISNNTFGIRTERGEFQFWDIPTTTLKKRIPEGFFTIISLDKIFYVTALENHNYPIELYNTQTHERLRTFKNSKQKYCHINFSQDKKRLLTLSTGSCLCLWDTESGTCIQSFQFKDKHIAGICESVHFTHDDSMVLIHIREDDFFLLDMETHEVTNAFRAFRNRSFAISPDGTIIASNGFLPLGTKRGDQCAINLDHQTSIQLLDFFEYRQQVLEDRRRKRKSFVKRAAFGVASAVAAGILAKLAWNAYCAPKS